MGRDAHRELLDRSLDVVTILDGDGRVRYENAAVTRVLGYDPEDHLGADAFDPVHPEDRSRVESAFRSVVSGV